MTPDERFTAKVDTSGDCHIWTGAIEKTGYGRVKFQGRLEMAHRAAWMRANGPIPRELVVDHLCRNRACVNPAHMELVTVGENTRRGNSPIAVAHRTGICKRGHSLTDTANVKVRDGRRYCLACIKVRNDARARARAAS